MKKYRRWPEQVIISMRTEQNNSMKKDLLIIGCFLDKDIKKTLVRENIKTLESQFDILLSSHFPIDADIQKLAKYCIYDSNNDIIQQAPYYIWNYYNGVYSQHHAKVSWNPSFAVYQLIRNPLWFAKNLGYTSFYYMEGDMLVGANDIQKIVELKSTATSQNKMASFFHTYPHRPWWDCQLFYSNIDFFLANAPVLDDSTQFIKHCHQIGNFVDIEMFLHTHLYANNPNKVHRLEVTPYDYMPSSQLNLTAVNSLKTQNTIELSQYFKSTQSVVHGYVSLVRLLDTHRIFLVCTLNRNPHNHRIDILIENTILLSPSAEGFYYRELDVPHGDTINVKILPETEIPIEYAVTTSAIFNSDDFINFDNMVS